MSATAHETDTTRIKMSTTPPAATIIAKSIQELDALSGGLLMFCHDFVIPINLERLPEYLKRALHMESCIFNHKRKKTDTGVCGAIGRRQYEAYWRCLMAWFVGVVIEHDFCLPLLTITISAHVLSHTKGVINAENFKLISFQKRMIMMKSKISNDLQRTIEYNYTSIIRNVYRQYYPAWGEWSEQEQKMADEIGKRALERVKVLGKNKGTFHESTLIMTAMDVLLSGHDQAPCNTRELGRILGVSERNYKHENSIQNLRQALVLDVESTASAVQASIEV